MLSSTRFTQGKLLAQGKAGHSVGTTEAAPAKHLGGTLLEKGELRAEGIMRVGEHFPAFDAYFKARGSQGCSQYALGTCFHLLSHQFQPGNVNPSCSTASSRTTDHPSAQKETSRNVSILLPSTPESSVHECTLEQSFQTLHQARLPCLLPLNSSTVLSYKWGLSVTFPP